VCHLTQTCLITRWGEGDQNIPHAENLNSCIRCCLIWDFLGQCSAGATLLMILLIQSALLGADVWDAQCQDCSCCCVVAAAFPTQLACTCAPITVCPISFLHFCCRLSYPSLLMHVHTMLSALSQTLLLCHAMQTILGTWPPLHIELASVAGDHTLLGAYPSDGLGPDGLPLPFPLTTPTSLDQGPTFKIGEPS
jgi:hypothetical protein